MTSNQKTSVLILVASIVTLFANYVITNIFTTRVISEDLLFNIFPYHIVTEYLSDILFFYGIYLFFFKYFGHEKKKRLEIINLFSIFYIARAILMMLTPLMRPTGVDIPSHGIFREVITQFGMFPSGHIGILALMYFMIEGVKYIELKKVYWWVLLISSFLMIISMGHYSIDVVGGIMLSYIIVSEWRKRGPTKNYLFAN
ncbi:MAG TPA: phosphatase PAP2 family protein [Candidatus Dojkabacteria bacterium]|nr:phosphatase PAP2 family protein [Candidatus Dojkabacteria bacterium]